jgi:hypothetical protein
MRKFNCVTYRKTDVSGGREIGSDGKGGREIERERERITEK